FLSSSLSQTSTLYPYTTLFRSHSLAASYVKSEEFEVTTPLQPAMASRDWAVIELAEKIDLKPIRVQPASEGGVASSRIVRAGYRDRKSTRLNSSHVKSSYAVFC